MKVSYWIEIAVIIGIVIGIIAWQFCPLFECL